MVFEQCSEEQVIRFFNSTANFVGNRVLSKFISGYRGIQFESINQIIVLAHNQAAMDLGRTGLFRVTNELIPYMSNYIPDAIRYIADRRTDPYDKMTFIEYLFAFCDEALRNHTTEIDQQINKFLSSSNIKLLCRDMLFFKMDDELTEKQIIKPFWDLVSDRTWKNVHDDMREAFRQKDIGGPDPSFYSARSLESAIKIISNANNWSSGREKGASNYIDNLISKSNGRFIEPWEGDILKNFFGQVRNPTAHGAGDAQQPRLSSHQTAWAIEFCMIWIKSLIGRL